MRLSLKAKIWFTLIAVVLMFAIFLQLYVPAQQEKYLLKNYNNEVQNLAGTVALGVKIALTEQNFEGVQTAIDFVKDDPRLQFVSIVQVDTIHENGTSSVTKKVFNSYPEGIIVSPNVLSNNTIVVKRSPFQTQTLSGEIMLGFSTLEITKSKQQIRITSFFVSAAVLLIGIIIGFWLARNISVPVLALRDAAIKVGAGDRSQHVRATGRDEIGELGVAFNKMVGDLLRAEEDLKKVNTDLIATNDELKNALNDLGAAQAQLIHQEKMASLGQLTAGIAHEINNPINFVSGNVAPLKRDIEELMVLLRIYREMNESNFTEKMEEISKLDRKVDIKLITDEINSLINGIEEGSSRTARIVKGLRNFSRFEENTFKMSDINEGIESTLILLHNKLNEKNIALESSLGEIPKIDCNAGQLNQVFMNLISNAIDATDENNNMSDGDGKTREKKIFITTSKDKNHIRISIRDTGPGMTEEVKQKLFDPFFTTKDVGKGTGLGLSISYGIIEKHNGKIEVISEPNKGAEFIISLPIAAKGDQ